MIRVALSIDCASPAPCLEISISQSRGLVVACAKYPLRIRAVPDAIPAGTNEPVDIRGNSPS
jgi:hypothetical protein